MEARRSANYKPSIWDDDYVQSLTTPYTGKEYVEEAEKLKRRVRMMIDETRNHRDQLELIDNLQRLDIAYHFKDRVETILRNINETREYEEQCTEKDLYVTSLKFRLLRQHGYHVPQEVLYGFTDEVGNLKACLACDHKSVLSLYEASFLSVEGENILDLARSASTFHLRKWVDEITDKSLAEQVRHALEMPLHWRVQKLGAKWYINVTESKEDANPILVQIAKLDFNMLQALHQLEIKQVSRWYKETGLEKKMGFARHRLAECFLWAMCCAPGSQFGYNSREILTKNGVLITIMDDMYDVYATMDELQALNDAIQRWDINDLEKLPEYMAIFFLALFNFTNQMAYHILKDKGVNIISNLRHSWAELSRAYYLEATWFHSGYFPSTEEYSNTAWVSISGPLILLHTYFSISNSINTEEIKLLEQYPGIIRWPSTILRLANDLQTSYYEMKRGDIPKWIQCRMHETKCSEKDAREDVKQLIDNNLKRMNKSILMEKSIKDLGAVAMNLARTSLCAYQYGDGFGIPQNETKAQLVSLVVDPIPRP